MTPAVNFINIKRANFLYESLFLAAFLVTFWLWWTYESTFVRKIRPFNVDEIDPWSHGVTLCAIHRLQKDNLDWLYWSEINPFLINNQKRVNLKTFVLNRGFTCITCFFTKIWSHWQHRWTDFIFGCIANPQMSNLDYLFLRLWCYQRNKIFSFSREKERKNKKKGKCIHWRCPMVPLALDKKLISLRNL